MSASSDRPLRLVLTIHHFLDRASGAPGVTVALAEAYEALGHRVEVIGFERFAVGGERARRVGFPAFVAARLWSMGRRERIDVVDASTGDAAWWCRVRPAGRPALVVRSHGLEFPMYESQREDVRLGVDRLSWHYRAYLERVELPRVRRTLECADAVTVCNGADAQYLAERLGVAPARIAVVPQGVDTAVLELGAHRDLTTTAPTIVAIGTFLPRKGIPYLVPAASEVMTADERVRMRFLGTGTDAATVRGAFAPELRSRVEVVPRFERSELVGLVGDARIGVVASVNEGSPVSLVELMALGLAPVVTDTPGMVETVVAGEDALVVPARQVAGLRDALAVLVRDPGRAARLGAAARVRVAGRGWARVAEDNLAVYRRALASRDADAGG